MSDPPRRRLARPKADKPSATPIPVEIRRYRVLYSTGSTVDYLSSSDNSTSRGFMVEDHFGKTPGKFDRIEGIVDMGVEYIHTPTV